MGHETVDNHNLSKHITDNIFLGTKPVLIRFTIHFFVINFGPCTNLALKQCSNFGQSMYLIRCLDTCSNKLSLLAKPGTVPFSQFNYHSNLTLKLSMI